MLSVSVSALALVRGVLWLRGAPSSSNGTRDGVTRTLALVERQQADLEKVVSALTGQQPVFARMGDQLERVADSLDRTVGNLTAITADVEHTQMDVAAHRVVSEQAVAQVAEIHAHLMRGRKR
ncbi:MAG: hypothetical protein A2W29_13450 [Gemmatimonadetes bacterium RBG_16_66_8]|nr:MAG: hypothetical protein A2W29_13450 [Gemmatimonadetes bacterium RBG_16_66_8]